MWKPLLAGLVLLLAGCTDEAASPQDDARPPGPAAPFAPKPEPMQFASGPYEDNLTGDATYSITDQAIIGVNSGEVIFDLTPIIPAEAPVEMTITLDANANVEFIDANAIGDTGFGTDFAFIVVRAPTGQVLLHVYNPGGFFPPNPAPTATFTARSVVRADIVNPGIPVAVTLGATDALNVTGEGIEEVVVFGPGGTLQRVEVAPFTVAANGTAGEYTLLVSGQQPVQLVGPDATLRAKRILAIEESPRALTSGSPTTWTVQMDQRPLQVRVVLEGGDNTPLFGVGAVMTQYALRVVAPNQVPILEASETCPGVCNFVPFGGGIDVFDSSWLSPHLEAGPYHVEVTYTGNNMQAYTTFYVIA